jgi:dihydrofolate reductase
MGARTFRDMSAYWPTATGPFAAPMNEIPKVVFSRSNLAAAETTRAIEDARTHAPSSPKPANPETVATWTNARVASGPLADEVARLKREASGPIVAHGGATFAQSLVQQGLVDEYRLLVHPVALGRGLPLFSTLTDPLALELVEVKRFERGAVAHVYAKRS